MPYQRINWKNGEAGGTPLNESNLNKMDSQIAQNVADIDELKNKPGGAMLVLTDASPLPATDSKPILGIDAKGKSEQKTTQTLATVQGNMPTVEVGSAINQTLGTSTTRCVSNIVRLGNGSVLSVTSGFEMYVLYAESENGNIVTANGWLTSRTVTADGFYRIQIRKADNSAITPTSFTLTASSTPTPTNPIPIIDASEEVSAIGKNLFDRYNVNVINDSSIGTVATDGSGSIMTTTNGTKVLYVKVAPNTIYTISKEVSNYCAVGFTSELPTIGVAFTNMNTDRNVKNATVTSGANAKYMIIFPMTKAILDSGITYNQIYQSLQIEVGATATAYEKYRSNSIYLPFNPKSVGSVANELIVNEDGSGKIVQRVGTKLLNGLEEWKISTWSPQTNTFCAYYLDSETLNINNDTLSIMSSKLGASTQASMSITDAEGITNSGGTNGHYPTIRILKSRIDGWSDGASGAEKIAKLKAYLSSNPIDMQYVKTTPIETPLTASEVASIRQLQTYKGTTIIESEMQIDSVTYSGDVKGYVDSKTDYSYTDTIIGKWADGKDLHRMVIQTNTPSTADTASYVSRLVDSSKCSIKNYYGCFLVSGIYISINYGYDEKHSKTNIDAYGISMTVSSGYVNSPCEIVVEYTLNEESGIALLSDEGEVVADE